LEYAAYLLGKIGISNFKTAMKQFNF
jgi:hypothetical protein